MPDLQDTNKYVWDVSKVQGSDLQKTLNAYEDKNWEIFTIAPEDRTTLFYVICRKKV